MKQQSKVIRDVQVANISNVPALYFFRAKVMEAVRQEVLHDLKHGRNVRVPAGCKGIYGRPNRYAKLWADIKSVPAKVWGWFKP